MYSDIALNLAYILRCAISSIWSQMPKNKNKNKNRIQGNHNTLMGHESFSREQQRTTQLNASEKSPVDPKVILRTDGNCSLYYNCHIHVHCLPYVTCQCWAPWSSSAICMVFVCACVCPPACSISPAILNPPNTLFNNQTTQQLNRK